MSNLHSLLRDLQRRKARERRGLVVAEGRRLVAEALADVRLPDGPAVVLVLDAVQDPGNVGTMIRTAFALGADLTVALDGSADLRNAKTVRAAMGAVFRHPVAHAHAAECLDFLAARQVVLWAATMDGEPIGRRAAAPGSAPAGPDAPALGAIPSRLALAVGNEGAGLRAELLAGAARRVAVPMRQSAESLNAAVAAGILLFQVLDVR